MKSLLMMKIKGRALMEHNDSSTIPIDLFKPHHVTHRIFLGPKFLFSLYHKRDSEHETSREFVRYITANDLPYRQLIVNEHSIDEAATRLKRRSSHKNATRMLTNIEESRLYRLESLPEDVFEKARKRFIEGDDKDASFTDFLIATHMDALEVEHIATYDPHFDTLGVNSIPYR